MAQFETLVGQSRSMSAKERESAPPLLIDSPLVAECEAGHTGAVCLSPVVVTQFDIRAVRNAGEAGGLNIDVLATLGAGAGECVVAGCGRRWRRRDPYGFRDQLHIRGRGWI